MSEKVIVRSAIKDIKNFHEMPMRRKGIIAEASVEHLTANYAVNSVANFLHPPTQYLKVKQVGEIKKGIRAYVLEPDTARGTAKLAYFRPGQSINITLNIGKKELTRTYTLCSSPVRSTLDEYVIIVKAQPSGFSSNYIINNWRKGTEITASAPFGNLYYQSLRDSKNIVAICDNEGFAPFLSMAEAVCDGSLNVDLTLLYSVRKQSDAILAERFDELSLLCENFKVIYILSDEYVLGKERGFVTKTLIEKYKPIGKFSVFINGTDSLINKTMPQIDALGIDNKYIRLGDIGSQTTPDTINGFNKNNIGKTFLCKVIKDKKLIATVPCLWSETIEVAIEKEGIILDKTDLDTRAVLVDGEAFISNETDNRRISDKKYNIIYLNKTYASSHITIEI